MAPDSVLTTLDVLRIIISVVCAYYAWRFVFSYGLTEWKNTAEGPHLLRFTAAIAMTFTLAVVWEFFSFPVWLMLVIAVVVYSVLAFELRLRFKLFQAAQLEYEQKEQEKE